MKRYVRYQQITRTAWPIAPRSFQARVAAAVLTACPAAIVFAQASYQLDPVVVTATRTEQRAFDLPVAIDAIDAARIQQGQLQVNLSESLVRVPGIVVNNRWNYAQDLQVSSRGFGSRAAFGTRGVRLFQDGIPATMPDGQGQTGSFSLSSAQRIEILRGPFSTLYGNAAGGVIAIFTEDGPQSPEARAQVIGGSYGTWNRLAKVGGEAAGINFVVAANGFRTDGYRDHSEASRDLVNMRLKFNPDDATRITFIGNSLYQPEAQDPLGLSRAQWQDNPRQADPVAEQFNTRKTVNQQQAGTTLEHRFGADTVARITGYGGGRTVRQYLALSGAAITSSGGVADLDRDFGGVDARIEQRLRPGGMPVTLTAGVAYDRQHERRRGFVNNNGELGALRRDEDNVVFNRDVYAQAEWQPLPSFSLLGGARYSEVRFSSLDHFIVPSNPDDSGSTTYTHTSPVVGAVWHANDRLNVYANWGQGFETPTFAELAYRNVGTGLNFDLKPSVNHSTEVGLKAQPTSSQRLTLAAFTIETRDEIVTDTASGGRTTFKNAGKTRRRGVEAAWEGELGAGFAAYAAATYLSAKFDSDIVSGTTPVTVAAGSRLPGVPASSAYAELSWAMPRWQGFTTALEVQYAGKVYVNDRNSDSAPSYAVVNLRAGWEQRAGAWTWREFVRINNVADRDYVGSVIVGDGNGRFFEPAAGRNFLLGISLDVKL